MTAKKASLLAKRLAHILYEAGRKRANGMISKGGTLMPFDEWVQKQLDIEAAHKEKP